jgi:uncharacterized membrane protein
MASRARETIVVELPPERAEALWLDTARWPTFVEGFKHVVEPAPEWPESGAKLVWQSIPGGRGRVTEKVVAREPGRSVATRVFEEQLTGTQTVRFEPAAPAGTAVEVVLEYELTRGGPLRAVANALFIRRALSDALARTLRRYAAEAADEAALPDTPR